MAGTKDFRSSWADETEQEEQQLPRKENAWSKGNPWGITVASQGNADNAHFPELKGEPNQQQKQGNSHESERRRDYPDRREPREFQDRREPREYNNDRRQQYPQERRFREDRKDFGEDRPDEERRPYPEGGRPYRNDQRRERRPSEGFSERTEKREPLPFPTQPPYTAFVGNLAYEIHNEDLFSFFGPDCKIASIRLLVHKDNKPKGYGYVEFEDLESLKKAVARNGELLMERTIRVDVAEAPKEKEDRGDRYRRDNKPPRERSFATPNYGVPFERERDTSRDNGEKGDEEPKQRPKLQLQPRSDTPKNNDTNEAYKVAKVNPFGEAKPRDEKSAPKKEEKPEEPPKPQEPKPQETKPQDNHHIKREHERTDRKDFQDRRDRDHGDKRPIPKREDKQPPKGFENNKPFVRGSKFQDKPRKEGQNRENRERFNKDKRQPRHEGHNNNAPKAKDAPQPVAPPPKVVTTNIFDALAEDEE